MRLLAFTVLALTVSASLAQFQVLQKVQGALPQCLKQYNPMKQISRIQSAIKEKGIAGVTNALENPDETVTCFSKCFMVEIGLIDENGHVNEETAKTLMNVAEKMFGRIIGGDSIKSARESVRPCLQQEWKDTKEGKCSGAWSLVRCIAEKVIPVIQDKISSKLGGFLG